jgi:hypothetical protein
MAQLCGDEVVMVAWTREMVLSSRSRLRCYYQIAQDYIVHEGLRPKENEELL